jgi:hypothetical protein
VSEAARSVISGMPKTSRFGAECQIAGSGTLSACETRAASALSLSLPEGEGGSSQKRGAGWGILLSPTRLRPMTLADLP